jgi:hypothetical protein
VSTVSLRLAKEGGGEALIHFFCCLLASARTKNHRDALGLLWVYLGELFFEVEESGGARVQAWELDHSIRKFACGAPYNILTSKSAYARS